MIIRDVTIEIEEEEVLRLLDCQKGTEIYEEFREEFLMIKEEMQAKCDPWIIIEQGEIPKELAGSDLPEGTKVLLVLYTIGGGISKYSTQAFGEGEYVKGMLANSMADAALFSLGRKLAPYLKEITAELGMGISKRLESPHDIGMEAQKLVYEKTHAHEVCGMGISSGFMLDPVKSSASVYVLSDDRELFFHQHNCRKCGRLDCKGRNIPDIPVKVLDGTEQYLLQVPDKVSLLEALTAVGDSSFGAVCGGTGRCGKCRIRVRSGYLKITDADKACLTQEELGQGIRLACRAYPQEPLEIELLLKEEMQVLTTYQEEQIAGTSKTEEAVTSPSDYVIAVDIGTTTVAMQLMKADASKVLDVDSSMNLQRSYGADVISRIKASMEGKGEALTQAIRRNLSEGIQKLLQRNHLTGKQLKKVAIACNTTMGHLLMGYDCSSLGRYPFQPVSVEPTVGKLTELLPVSEQPLSEWAQELEACEYYLLPGISAFVGADIVAGLCFAGTEQDQKLSLLVDLGTNGEIALGNQEKILVTSTAAGPAFEGGNLTWGIGSVEGAICGFRLQDDKPVVRTIGDKAPIGICGTGVIEAVAALYEAGIIDETGLLEEQYFEEGYPLAQTADDRWIVLTQKDIREIQLAKAAVRAGIEVLLLRYQVRAEEVERVYLAGGFGFGLDVAKAVKIGMLPEALLGKVHVIGNSSLGGAARCLTSEAFCERAARLGRIAQELNLSADEKFNEYYMRYMYFEEEEI